MKYTLATPGRIFIVKFEPEENILAELKQLIKQENIKSGVVHLIGALANTDVILGPQKKEYPPEPIQYFSEDTKEILALGIFAWENNEPKLHLHAGMGNKKETKLGCLRNNTEVYLTIEGVIQEFTDTNVTRKFDDNFNVSLLNFEEK